MTVFALSGGSVDLGGRPVLHDVDVVVDEGEFVALLGHNGSGKTTLVRTLVGLVPLRSGSLELFGTPIARFREWRRIGYVPQRLEVGGGVPATVREVVESGLAGRRRSRSAVDHALEDVGLGGYDRRSVRELSGGQQQRVLIARALAGEPDVLVMDEPTAGVDADSQDLLAGALGHLSRAGGSVVLVAHELGPLATLIRRAVVLSDGRVVHDGAPPQPEGHHAEPGHAHQHAHGPSDPQDPFGTLFGRP